MGKQPPFYSPGCLIVFLGPPLPGLKEVKPSAREDKPLDLDFGELNTAAPVLEKRARGRFRC